MVSTHPMTYFAMAYLLLCSLILFVQRAVEFNTGAQYICIVPIWSTGFVRNTWNTGEATIASYICLLHPP
jgi:hypothetical protein